MSNKNCNRRKILVEKLINDWDELNIPFKALIIVGIVLFIVVIFIGIFSNGGSGIQNSLEVVFRSTLASVIGFLLSSNIKFNRNKRNTQIEKIQSELNQIQSELKILDDSIEDLNNKCKIEENYIYKEVNLVQIVIALGICIACIFILSILLITHNLENVPAVSQIRDLMCSSIGFLIGESGKK